MAGTAKATKKQADEMFSGFIDMGAALLEKDERVALPGLGVFSVAQRAGRRRGTAGTRKPAPQSDTGSQGGEISAYRVLKQGLDKTKK